MAANRQKTEAGEGMACRARCGKLSITQWPGGFYRGDGRSGATAARPEAPKPGKGCQPARCGRDRRGGLAGQGREAQSYSAVTNEHAVLLSSLTIRLRRKELHAGNGAPFGQEANSD